MRKLASIQTVSEIHPIDGKDRIVLAIVQGWQVIVRKDEYQVGDKTVFIEPDAVLPEREEFEFLRSKKFRIKTMKMGGVLSQGICFPLSILPERDTPYELDEDVTEILGIKKYEPYEDEPVQTEAKPKKKLNPVVRFMLRVPGLRWIAKKIWKNKPNRKAWPEFLQKTDETRIQNMPFILNRKDLTFEVHEKVDGQSGTFFLKKEKKKFPWSRQKYDFGVCSRNLRLFTPDKSSYWTVAERYKIKDVLMKLIGNNEWVAIQGECVAPNVQGNKYHVTEPDLYCFNLIFPDGKLDSVWAQAQLSYHGLKWVPLIEENFTLPDTVEEMLTYATGTSKLYDTLREGVVVRNYEHNISFKAVSPDFLIKWDQ